MIKRLIFLSAILINVSIKNYAGSTFYYRYNVDAQPTGYGKVYVSNEPLETEVIEWSDSYQSPTYSWSSQVIVQAATVTVNL